MYVCVCVCVCVCVSKLVGILVNSQFLCLSHFIFCPAAICNSSSSSTGPAVISMAFIGLSHNWHIQHPHPPLPPPLDQPPRHTSTVSTTEICTHSNAHALLKHFQNTPSLWKQQRAFSLIINPNPIFHSKTTLKNIYLSLSRKSCYRSRLIMWP